MKYKLKKWYPGIPEEYKPNDIGIRRDLIVKRVNGRSYHPDGDISNKAIYSKEVENNPEFWEKVEEKDYEILSVKGRYTGKIYKKHSTGCYYNRDCGVHPYSPDIDIHSVKRLSDGEVFTVGDSVTYINGKTKTSIKEFIVDFHTLKVKVASQHSPTGYTYYHINHTSKAKEPLFTTEDGVDIYEGDEYWFLVPHNDKIYHNGRARGLQGAPCNKHFSTKEKAEEYIDQHKPRYSKVDIRKALKSIDKDLPHWIKLKPQILINQLELDS